MDHLGAVRGECDGGETASGWPHGATVSDGEARERVAVRFDVMAIEEFSSQAPVVRLHKNAFNPRMQEGSLENPQESPERGNINVSRRSSRDHWKNRFRRRNCRSYGKTRLPGAG